MKRFAWTILLTLLAAPAYAQISYERILQAEDEPESWLTYNGSYMSQRYSRLTQIDQDNVEDLELRWLLQNQV
ncbi:MAG: hypothetical protein F4Z61_07525, partial [Acidimicrobiia bacterium]|nr:hypothetical protein [Acidimicrobiia bacterium]